VYNGRVHDDDNPRYNHRCDDNNNHKRTDESMQHSMGNVERLFIDVCWWHTNTRVLNGIER
jgi:hypothetical protein